MGFLVWILLGLVSGIIAKFIMPGKDPGGLIITILIGIAGAFIGGFIGSFFGMGEVSGLNLASVLTSVFGALVLLFIFRKIRG